MLLAKKSLRQLIVHSSTLILAREDDKIIAVNPKDWTRPEVLIGTNRESIAGMEPMPEWPLILSQDKITAQ